MSTAVVPATALTASTFDSVAAYATALERFIRADDRFTDYIGYRPHSLEESSRHLVGFQWRRAFAVRRSAPAAARSR